MTTGLFLGYRAFIRSTAAGLVAVVAIAACLLPILIVAGLKSGYIDAVMEEMRSDPRNLEIRLRGDKTLRPEDLDAIRAVPGVGYVEPTTRGLSLRVNVAHTDGRGRTEAALLPSSSGDPLLDGGHAPAIGEAIVSDALSRLLKVGAGDKIALYTVRNGGAQSLKLELAIVSILPPQRLSGSRILVNPPLILDFEAFADGHEVPEAAIGGTAAAPAAYANARIYVRSIGDVGAAALALQQLGHFVDTDAAAIHMALALDHAASTVAVVFGLALSIGAIISLWGALSLRLDPQRKHLALLVLMGGTRIDILAFVLVQACGLGCAGIVSAWLGYLATARTLNLLFVGLSPADRPVCWLSPLQISTVAAIATFIMIALAVVFSLRCWTISPAGAFRNEN